MFLFTPCSLVAVFCFFLFVVPLTQATPPSELWLKDLDALGDVLDEIAEITRKQDVEDAKQRKNAGKRKVHMQIATTIM